MNYLEIEGCPQSKTRFYEVWLLAFFSPKLYREVARTWQGTGFLYLFLLLAVCWIPLIYFIVNGLVFFKTNVFKEFLQAIPAISIVNGELAMKEASSFVFPSSGDPFLIIDTSGRVDDISKTTAEILITKKQMSIQDPQPDSGQIRHYPLPDTMNMTLEPEELEQKLTPLLNNTIFFIYPILVFLSLIYRFLQAVFFAVMGFLVLRPIFRARLNYSAVIRIVAVALTPAIIISTILSVMHIHIDKEYLLYLLLSIAYLCFGIRANRCYSYSNAHRI